MLRLGVPQKYACEACNIDESTFYIWMKLGKKKTEGKYSEFFKSVNRIPGEAIAVKLLAIQKAAERGSAQAAIWWLERHHPELYPPNNKLLIDAKLEHVVTQPIQFTVIDKITKDENAKPTTTNKSADDAKANPGDKDPAKTKQEH